MPPWFGTGSRIYQVLRLFVYVPDIIANCFPETTQLRCFVRVGRLLRAAVIHKLKCLILSSCTRTCTLVNAYLSKHSTSTGLAPIRRIADGTAVKVKALERTSSPALTPQEMRPIRIAEEHEFTPRAYLEPVVAANSSSSLAT